MKNTLYKIDKKLEKITNIKFLIIVIILILIIIIFAIPQNQKDQTSNKAQQDQINNKAQQECQKYEEKLKKSFRIGVFDRNKEEYNNCLEYWNWFYSDKQGEKI